MQESAHADYNFVWRADSAKLPRVLALRDWLLHESARAADDQAPRLA